MIPHTTDLPKMSSMVANSEVARLGDRTPDHQIPGPAANHFAISAAIKVGN